VYDLAKKYQLDVSLFERLILGGMKAVRLGVQHRMRPEIVRLIVPTIYEELENYSTVYNHPHVPGMEHDVFTNIIFNNINVVFFFNFNLSITSIF
jgi:hypothetical protein